MRIATVSCLILLLGVISACKTDGSSVRVSPEMLTLVGVWEDSGGCSYTIEKKGKQLEVTSIVDSDGEAFAVTASTVADGAFSFTYLVPSTTYIVTHWIRQISATEFVADWENQHDSGSDTFYRTK